MPPFRLRLALSAADFAMRRLYPRFVTGLEHYTASPGTLVVSNHRRDHDGPLLGSVLLRRRHGQPAPPLPHFVARDDLFERGFLAHYLRRRPAGLRPVLRIIDLRRLLVGCGAGPLLRTHERSVAEALQDVLIHLGDMPVAGALRPRKLAALAGATGLDLHAATVADLVQGHYYTLWRKRYGYRCLHLAVFRRLKPYLRASIEQQLDRFSALLQCGHMVILEPEGRLSHDGTLRRPRAALHELVNRPQASVRVLPVAVTYDTLTTGRPRIFVDIRNELTGLQSLPRRALEQRVMAAVRAGCRVTGGQLAASFLLGCAGAADAWTETALVAYVYAAARQCGDAGLPIDPCLQDRRTCERRTRDIVGWGLRTRFLARAGDDRLRVRAPAMPPPWLQHTPATLLDYLHMELLETVGQTRARDLGLVP